MMSFIYKTLIMSFFVVILSVSTRSVNLVEIVLDVAIPIIPVPHCDSDALPNFYEEVEESFKLKVDDRVVSCEVSLSYIQINGFKICHKLLSKFHAEIFIPPLSSRGLV